MLVEPVMVTIRVKVVAVEPSAMLKTIVTEVGTIVTAVAKAAGVT